MKGFFENSLAGVKVVLENQLELAESQQHRVQKVILTGGFGQSPSLRSYLRKYLQERRNIKDWEIDLVVPRNP
jgi:actin-related protein